MLHLDEYDLVILGSGQSGKYLARTLASQGKHVAVIEREYIGGSCNAVACLPSKNVIHMPRSSRISAGVRSSASPRDRGKSKCPACAIVSARWSTT